MSKMKEMKAEIDMHHKMTASQILETAGIKSQQITKYEEKRNPQLHSTKKNVEKLIDNTPRTRNQQEQDVQEVIEICRAKTAEAMGKNALKRSIAKKMEGRTRYPIPNAQALEKVYAKNMITKKQKLMEHFANNREVFEARMSVKTTSMRYKEKHGDAMEPFMSYIKDFKTKTDLSRIKINQKVSSVKKKTQFQIDKICHQPVQDKMKVKDKLRSRKLSDSSLSTVFDSQEDEE